MTLTLLGNQNAAFKGLETFDAPEEIEVVCCISDEVSALCPVTHQPDQYTVEVKCHKPRKILESKSLKLYLQQFRNEGIFCEGLAARVAREVEAATEAEWVEVSAALKARGGVSIIATAKKARG